MDLDRSEETLRLMQLCSPMLPTGAFAYSQGLEFAISSGWIKDDETTKVWIYGLLQNSLTYLDVPLLSRLYKAWSVNDMKSVLYWNDYLYASRDSKELREEEEQLAHALARLLGDLGVSEAIGWKETSSHRLTRWYFLKTTVSSYILTTSWIAVKNLIYATVR